jgi:acetyl esterase/lipase
VYHYLCSHGYSPKNIGIIGDSAGGGLALALQLRLKELHTELPAAIGLLSPWADLNLSGDTMTTLSEVDPILRKEQLSACAKLYVQEEDVQNPLVSPVYGDFTGFPPMMMITGSREILLSDTLRIAQKALNDQVEVRFEIVEGLWHVFCADPSLPKVMMPLRNWLRSLPSTSHRRDNQPEARRRFGGLTDMREVEQNGGESVMPAKLG